MSDDMQIILAIATAIGSFMTVHGAIKLFGLDNVKNRDNTVLPVTDNAVLDTIEELKTELDRYEEAQPVKRKRGRPKKIQSM